jgi:N-acetylmuramoyl-L-alanine amidase
MNIHYIVLHCIAVPVETIIEYIKEYWKKELHWRHPGYHYIVGTTGKIEKLLLENSDRVKGYKRNSIHFSFVEAHDKQSDSINDRIKLQSQAVGEKLKELKFEYPNVRIIGEIDFLIPDQA